MARPPGVLSLITIIVIYSAITGSVGESQKIVSFIYRPLSHHFLKNSPGWPIRSVSCAVDIMSEK